MREQGGREGGSEGAGREEGREEGGEDKQAWYIIKTDHISLVLLPPITHPQANCSPPDQLLTPRPITHPQHQSVLGTCLGHS